jgi:hypothetical protein
MIDFDKLKKNLMKKYTSPMVCYKHPSQDLVFYPHQKCASSTYRLLFENLKWNHICITDINWKTDKVFAHIKDPLVRHRKGIVEGICQYFPEVKDFFITPNGAKFLTNITIVESHSYTIEKWLGQDHATLVHWIPIDTDLDHIQETFNFLEQRGVPVSADIKEWFKNLPRQNESNPDEIELYNLLVSHDPPGEILRYIDFDRCLYSLVLDQYQFEPKNYRQRVEQLKITGFSELEAQEQVDKEVESGEYLNWNIKQ